MTMVAACVLLITTQLAPHEHHADECHSESCIACVMSNDVGLPPDPATQLQQPQLSVLYTPLYAEKTPNPSNPLRLIRAPPGV